jgi:ribonuclease HI
MKHVDVYVAADSSFYDIHPKDRAVAYMLEFNGKAVVDVLQLSDACGNEAALLGLLAALNRLNAEVEVTVHVESTYLLSQINTGNIYLWMDRKGLKGDMRPIRYKDTWMIVLIAIQMHCLERIRADRNIQREKLEKLKSCIEGQKGA